MNIRPLPCPPDLHAERDAIAKAIADAMTSSGEFDGGLAYMFDTDEATTSGVTYNDTGDYYSGIGTVDVTLPISRRVQPYLLHSGGDYHNDVRVDVGCGEKVVKATGDTAEYAPGDITGTAISGGNYSASYPASNAFDASLSTFWQSSQMGTAVSGNAYIGMGFSDTHKLQSVRFYTYSNTANNISAVTLQGSDDGVTWTTIKAFTGLATTASSWVTLDGFDTVTFKQYRLLAASNPGTSYTWAVYEVEFTFLVEYNILRAPLQRIDHLTQSTPQCRVHLRNNEQRLKGIVLVEER